MESSESPRHQEHSPSAGDSTAANDPQPPRQARRPLTARQRTVALAGGVGAIVALTTGATTLVVSAGEHTPAAALFPSTPTATSTATSPSASLTPTVTSTPSVSTSPQPTDSAQSAESTSPAPEQTTALPDATTPPTANYVDAWIPMPQSRLDEMAQYAQARYATATSSLAPSMIVLHFTEGSASGTMSMFAEDTPQGGVYPGVCAHFVIDQSGAVFRLVPTTTMCRHVVGLNNHAIGIEIEQSTLGNSSAWADQQILNRPAQITAVLATIKDLQRQYGIPSSRIIGHAMANDDPAFLDLTGVRNDHTDMGYDAVMEIRRRVDAVP